LNDSDRDLDWPEWPKPRRGKVPDSFRKYHERLKRILGDGPDASAAQHLYLLPPSVHELARRGEESAEFFQLLIDLFESKPADETLNFFRDLLRLSGYYQAVIAGTQPDVYFQRIVDRLQYGEREFPRFWLLAGCSFPSGSFQLAGYSIVKLGAQELTSLGPEPGLAEMFVPDEKLDADRYSHFWFLTRRDDFASGLIGEEQWRVRLPSVDDALEELLKESDRLFGTASPVRIPISSDSLQRTNSPGRWFGIKATPSKKIIDGALVSAYSSSRPQLISGRDTLATPLLILSLYSHEFFDIPLAFIADPGWRVWWVKRGNPRDGKYKVAEGRWEKFQEFIRVAEKGLGELKHLGARKDGFGKKFQLAVERYFRATFVSVQGWLNTLDTEEYISNIDTLGTELSPKSDDAGVIDETLLQYVLSLEALLFSDLDKEKDERNQPISITSKFASRLAAIIGRSGRETREVNRIARKVYNSRSRIVHGDEPEEYPDFQVTRRLCQSAICILLFLVSSNPGQRISEIVFNLSSKDQPNKKAALAKVASARSLFYDLVAEPDRFDPNDKIVAIGSAKERR